jgi:hypothetical protein
MHERTDFRVNRFTQKSAGNFKHPIKPKTHDYSVQDASRGESRRPPNAQPQGDSLIRNLELYNLYRRGWFTITVDSNRRTDVSDGRWLQDRGLPGAHGRPAEQTQLLESNRPERGDALNEFQQCFVLSKSTSPCSHDFASLL